MSAAGMYVHQRLAPLGLTRGLGGSDKDSSSGTLMAHRLTSSSSKGSNAI